MASQTMTFPNVPPGTVVLGQELKLRTGRVKQGEYITAQFHIPANVAAVISSGYIATTQPGEETARFAMQYLNGYKTDNQTAGYQLKPGQNLQPGLNKFVVAILSGTSSNLTLKCICRPVQTSKDAAAYDGIDDAEFDKAFQSFAGEGDKEAPEGMQE